MSNNVKETPEVIAYRLMKEILDVQPVITKELVLSTYEECFTKAKESSEENSENTTCLEVVTESGEASLMVSDESGLHQFKLVE